MNDSTISQATELDRRQFLKATGGFLLALTLPAMQPPAQPRSMAQLRAVAR